VRRFVGIVLAVLTALLCSIPALAQDAGDASNAPQPRRWLWRFVAGGATVGSGAVGDDGRYYFAAEDRYLYALDRNGIMIWRTDLGRLPAGGIVVGTDGTLFVTLANGELLALNRDGRLIWREEITGGDPLAPVVLRNGVIVTVRRPSRVEARTHFGELVWELDVEAPVSAAPVLGPAGNVLVPTAEGEVVAVSIDGRPAGRRYIGEIASVLGIFDGGTLLGSTSGRVIAMDEQLEPIWRADVGSAVREIRVGANGDIYATSDDGGLSRITPVGAVAWKAQPGRASMQSPSVSNDVLVTVSDGLLTRLGREGVPVWQMRLLDLPLGMTTAPYGAVIVATQSWVTYAYEVRFEPSGAWPQERGGGDRRGVDVAADTGRVSMEAFERSVDYLALRSYLLTGGPSEQVVAMAGIASRIADGENLAGRHHYMLHLSEQVAGSPYFGPLTQFGPKSAPRRARELAVQVLGEIGDLATGRFLARLLRYEPDHAMQASILRSMGRLGTAIDSDLAARLREIVRRDVVRGPSDRLGSAMVRFVEAIDAYRGGYLDPAVAEVLLEIASANYGRAVRRSALDAVRSLAGPQAP
jgi:outer membrane protein assembly factor BamB